MSSPTRFARIEELFHQAIDLSPEERLGVLEPLRQSRPDEYDAVLRLLQRADRGGSGPSTAALSPVALDGESSLAEVSRLGPYRLLRKVGAGGMGVVYEAEQEEPIQRRVAIKLVPAGFDSARIVARFQAERQTLALMSHPNIAQVFDAGEAPDGRPFFAMEFVDGEPITGYCDENRLGIEERLELLLEVCDAMQHAHQKGVIHRDLKPSNVLVALNGRPVPKVIDFGIAKATAFGEIGSQSLTRAGEVVGTPEYMSPEQMLGDGADVDTRSDVYSLGVVLYEMLVGHLPFAAEETRSSAESSREPSRPSARMRPTSAQTTSIAECRGLTPGALVRRLEGDLDWISLRALEHDRERRYPSVAALAADLGRFLRHEPVEAGPPNAAYRLSKFVRRHRVAVSAAGTILLTLLVAVVAATGGLLRARHAESQARLAEASAREEAETAQRVTEVLVDLFAGVDPYEADGREVTAREIFERGAEKVREELAGEDAVQARLLETIGRVYTNLALHEEARAVLTEAVELRRRHNEDPEGLAKSLVALGKLERQLERAEAAESAFREALAILEGDGLGARDIGATLNDLAMLLARRDPEEALRLYERSLEITSREFGEDSGQAGMVLANRAAVYARSGQYDRARDDFERALTLVEKGMGEDDPRVGGILGNLSFVHRKIGNYVRARELQERDLEHSIRALGADHPTVATSLVNLSQVSRRLGEFRAAREQAQRAIEILEPVYAPDHFLVRAARNTFAAALQSLGDYAGARAVLESLIAGQAPEADDRGSQGLLRNLLLLSENERLDGRPQRSLELARQALTLRAAEVNQVSAGTAHWAAAYALAALRDPQATAERDLAFAAHEGQDAVLPADLAFSQGKYWALAGDVDRALDHLAAAVAAGFNDSAVLHSPAFAEVRESPRFASIAAGVAARQRGDAR